MELERTMEVTAANMEVRKRLTLMADKLCVFAGEKQILHDVSVVAKSGSLLAVMGPSGSGKTTLMNAVSGRMPLATGSITVGGKAVSPRMRKSFGYVTQMDVFFPILTLKQTVEFAARVKLPDSMTEKERKARIDDVIESLELKKCMNTIMGNFTMPGLSGGEKKRANVACELLRNPEVLLLDEPTSGLDSSLAMTLIDLLRNWSVRQNKIVIASIHQPSSQIFYMFDDLLLLTDGRISYCGMRSGMVDYFESIDVPFYSYKHWNPADYMLEIVKSSSDSKMRIIEEGARFSDINLLKSQKAGAPVLVERKSRVQNQGVGGGETNGDLVDNEKQVDGEIEYADGLQRRGKGSAVSLGHLNPSYDEAEKAENGGPAGDIQVEIANAEVEEASMELAEVHSVKWVRQLTALTIRGFYLSKNRFLSVFPIVQTLFVVILCSLLWLQFTRTEENINNILGCIFFLIVHLSFASLLEATASFQEDILIVKHERRAGMYQIGAYYVAKMLTEMPMVIVMPFISLTLVYWIAGLGTGVEYIPFVFGILTNSIACQGIGFFIGLLTDNPKANLTIAYLYNLFCLLLGGYLITAIPIWLSWARYIAFYRYCYHFCMLLSLPSSPSFLCATSRKSIYSTCQNFTTINATTPAYFPSSEIINSFSDQPLPLWADYLVMLLFVIAFRVAGYLWLRYMNKV